ncbi:MAG: uroporphyrinogen decarboxylase family protein [Planctomycetota bacterium]
MGAPAISIEGSASIGWLHEACGFVADERFYFDPEVRNARAVEMEDFLARRYPDFEINFFEANMIQSAFWRRDQILVGAIQPNMILGMAVGAAFLCPGDKDPDIAPAPLADLDAAGLERLRGIEWEKAGPIPRFLGQIDAMRAKHPGRPVIPTYFWDVSGRASFHGPVTTAQKLLGERAFMLMFDDPDFLKGLLGWIADAYVTLARLFASRAGLAITGMHVGECSGCMLSPSQFDEFSAPYIQRMVDALGPGRIHTCGLSNHLIPCFAKLKNVRCINTGSLTSVRKIREACGPGIRVETAPLAKLLASGTPDDARKFVDQSVEENGPEGALGIVHHLDRGYPEANVLALHERLIERGLVRRGRRHPAGG